MVLCGSLVKVTMVSAILWPLANAAMAAEKTCFYGFGELHLAYFDFPAYAGRDRLSGPQRDQRLLVDLTRLVIARELTLAKDLEGTAELTIRHRGSLGSAEPNFGGPFNEEQHGSAADGSVELTKAYLSKRLGEHAAWQIGRIPVGVGLLAMTETPLEYLGANPFFAETDLIPEDWTELGTSLTVTWGPLKSLTELVSGLDSTGFSAYHFVANGQQGRYGYSQVTEPAGVQRLDLVMGGITAGSSIYYGQTSQNRPTPNMARPCGHDEKVAACGYIHAPLTIVDLHVTAETERIRLHGLLLRAFLHNAAAINFANEHDQTNLPGIYSPVSSRVQGASAEIAVNVLGQKEEGRIAPFLRYERINTMWGPLAQNAFPIYDRTMRTVGVLLKPSKEIFVKVDYSERRFHDSRMSYETLTTLASGVLF